MYILSHQPITISLYTIISHIPKLLKQKHTTCLAVNDPRRTPNSHVVINKQENNAVFDIHTLNQHTFPNTKDTLL